MKDEKPRQRPPRSNSDELPAVPGYEAIKDVTDAMLRANPSLTVEKLKSYLDEM